MTGPPDARTVHVIVPDAIDDPARPSGGNRYNRRVCSGLARAGWQVCEHAIPDAWPQLGTAGLRAAARVVHDLPDKAVVLVDGLIASAGPPVFVPAAARLSIVVLVHLPLGADAAGRAAEAAVLSAVRGVIATSAATRHTLLTQYALRSDAVHVAEPGTDPGLTATASPHGGRLLNVAAVAPHKGHDVLLAALAQLDEWPWRCDCIGPLDRAPEFVARLRSAIEAAGLAGRLRLVGARSEPALDRYYRRADLLVHAAPHETYGMVVTEALARGVPVIAAAAGGLPQAVGRAPDGTRPGLLIPPADATALAAAVRTWLSDAQLRHRLRRAAMDRRAALPHWAATVDHVARALTAGAA